MLQLSENWLVEEAKFGGYHVKGAKFDSLF